VTIPLQTAQEIYRLFGAGNLEGVLELCAPDIEWVVNGPAELEKCRAFQGRDGVRRFFRILGGIWTFRSFVPREFLVQGESVVALGEEIGNDKHTAIPFQNRWVHIFDVKDGQLVRFREFLCCWFGDQTPPPTSWGPHSKGDIA